MQRKWTRLLFLGLTLAAPVTAQNERAGVSVPSAQRKAIQPVWAGARPSGVENVEQRPPQDSSTLAVELRELKELILEQAKELEAQRVLLREQQQKMEAMERQMQAAPPPAAQQPDEPDRLSNLQVMEGQLEAVAENTKDLGQKVGKLEADLASAQKSTEGKLRGLGNFNFSGDIRLRYEPFFQGGGFVTRHRERIRARLNLTGKLTDEISGGISIASGTLDDVNSSNQTLTGFFTRKTIGFDRYFVTYKPLWFKPVTLTGGKFAYPWFRTPLTFDTDVNPEGFAQTFSFDLEGPGLKNITLVGFQLPFNEASGSYDSFVLGGQVQTRWKLSDKLGLGLYAAGVNFNRADPVAVAIANGSLRPSLSNTNRFRTNASGQVVGYASKFLYFDLIGTLDYKLHPRLPVQLLFNFVNNTRAATRERSGYWGEIQFGRLAEQRDVQFSYALVRIEREAVIGAFNESDLRASTNVRNHRFGFGYQAYRNVTLNYVLWLGRLANPQDHSSQVPPDFRSACSTPPFTGCEDPYLKRMQFDLIYKF